MITVPQTNINLSPYNYGNALTEMGKITPFDSLATWLKDQGTSIANRNAIDAQDYLSNLDVDAYTRAKAAGLNVLDEYAKGRYFFNKYDPVVRATYASAVDSEKEHMQNKLANKFVDMANKNELNAKDIKAIAESMGFYNRSTKELEALNEKAQDTLDKRYSTALKQQAAQAKLNNQNPNDIVREQLAKYGITKDINQYTSPEAINSQMGELIKGQMRQAIASLGPNPQTSDIEAIQAKFLPYTSYLSPEDQGQYLEGLKSIKTTSVSNRLSELYRQALQQDPDQLRGMSQSDIFDKILLPQLISEGYNLGDIYPIATSFLGGRNQFIDSFRNPFDEEVASAKHALDTLREAYAPLLTAIKSPGKSRFTDEDTLGFDRILSMARGDSAIKNQADKMGISVDALVRGILESSTELQQYLKYSQLADDFNKENVQNAIKTALGKLSDISKAEKAHSLATRKQELYKPSRY